MTLTEELALHRSGGGRPARRHPLHHRAKPPQPRPRPAGLLARRAHAPARHAHRPNPRGDPRGLGRSSQAPPRLEGCCISCIATGYAIYTSATDLRRPVHSKTTALRMTLTNWWLHWRNTWPSTTGNQSHLSGPPKPTTSSPKSPVRRKNSLATVRLANCEALH